MLSSLACCFWWLLLGLFLGALLSWLYDKFFLRDGGDLIAEKDAEINRLTADLRDTDSHAKDELNALRKAISDKDDTIATLKNKLQSTEAQLHDTNKRLAETASIEEGYAQARRFGFMPLKDGEDDLTIIEGIGPKISALLKQTQYGTFASLAGAEVEAIQAILDDAGSRFKLAKPESWPKQAKMCVGGKWEELKRYQDNLVGGIEFDDE